MATSSLADLARRDRIKTFYAHGSLAVGDRLYLKRVERTEIGYLLEAERSILDQPHGCALGIKRDVDIRPPRYSAVIQAEPQLRQ